MDIYIHDILNVIHKLPNPNQYQYYYAVINEDVCNIYINRPEDTEGIIEFRSKKVCSVGRCWNEWVFDVTEDKDD